MQWKHYVFNPDGTPLVGETVTLHNVSGDTLISTTTTNSSGCFTFTGLDDDKQYYAKITDGTTILRRHGDTETQLAKLCVDVVYSRTATELTLDTNGAITITQNFHTVDTFGDAASDEIVTINGGFANQIITIWAANASRDIVIPLQASPSANGVYNNTIAFTMNITQDRAQLMFDDSLGYWILLNPRNAG